VATNFVTYHNRCKQTKVVMVVVAQINGINIIFLCNIIGVKMS